VLADIASVAGEGLLAMSVTAAQAVVPAMLRPRDHRGGRRVEVTRPRARTLDGHEVPLQADSQFAADDLLSQVVLERMLAGVATRRHTRNAETIGKAVLDSASCTGRSVVSRRFMKETETALAELHAWDLTQDKPGQDARHLEPGRVDDEHRPDYEPERDSLSNGLPDRDCRSRRIEFRPDRHPSSTRLGKSSVAYGAPRISCCPAAAAAPARPDLDGWPAGGYPRPALQSAAGPARRGRSDA